MPRASSRNDTTRVIAPIGAPGLMGADKINQHRLDAGDIADLDHVSTVIDLSAAMTA